MDSKTCSPKMGLLGLIFGNKSLVAQLTKLKAWHKMSIFVPMTYKSKTFLIKRRLKRKYRTKGATTFGNLEQTSLNGRINLMRKVLQIFAFRIIDK